MRKLTRIALWLFVFSVPSALMDSAFGLGSVPRVLGIVAISLGVLTTLIEGRIRKPTTIFWAGFLFAISSAVSLLWTVSYAETWQAVSTYVQLVGVIWVVGEFVRSTEEYDSLILALWLGACVLGGDLLLNFDSTTLAERFTATDFNPNYVGFALAMAFPLAWRHALNRRGPLRIAAVAFCLLAPFAVVLTASRGAILTGLVSLTIIPLTLRRSFWPLMSAATGLSVAVVTMALFVPPQTWNRVLATTTEVETREFGGRGDIWNAGWTVFLERPVLGAGSGTFLAAVAGSQRPGAVGHNTALSLLVEQGVLGLFLFVLLVSACASTILRLPPADRKTWAILITGWFVSSMAHDFHIEKLTWLLFGLLAAQGALKPVPAAVRDAPASSHRATGELWRPPFVSTDPPVQGSPVSS